MAQNETRVPVHILHYGWDSLEQIIAKKTNILAGMPNNCTVKVKE